MKVAHIITRMIVGGAQENTLLRRQARLLCPTPTCCLSQDPRLEPKAISSTNGRAPSGWWWFRTW